MLPRPSHWIFTYLGSRCHPHLTCEEAAWTGSNCPRVTKSEREPSLIKPSCIFPKVCHFFFCASDTQAWLHIRIMWRSFKTYQCLGLITDQLNQNVCEYGTSICVLNHLPGWAQHAVTMENHSSLSSCRIQSPFIPVFLPGFLKLSLRLN